MTYEIRKLCFDVDLRVMLKEPRFLLDDSADALRKSRRSAILEVPDVSPSRIWR